MKAIEIYVARGGQQLGPYTPEDITRQIKEGSLKRDDLAWTEGCADWMSIGRIPGLSLPSGPPPPPPASSCTVPPPPPPGTIATSTIPETLGTIALVIPLIGALLCFFWVGSMNLLQDPGSTINMIAFMVVIGTAVLIGTEASQLRMASPEDKARQGTNSITPPIVWAIGAMLLWVVVFPAYFNVRARYGMGKLFVRALLITILFAVSFYIMSSAVEDRKHEVRQGLQRAFSH